MMFLFGAILGATLASGSSTASLMGSSGLAGIPLRCLMVQTEAEYKDCRRLSMRAELMTQSRDSPTSEGNCAYYAKWPKDYATWKDVCDVDKAMGYEIVALKHLNEALASKK